MSSDYSLEIRLIHLEDQVNRMNMVLSEQRIKMAELSDSLAAMARRVRTLERDLSYSDNTSFLGPSDTPPDGVNR
jgi:uncharacterized coiled-coil protein SlyX